MPLTTSYFAVANRLKGTKISIARFTRPRISGGIDEIMDSFAPSKELLRSYKDNKTTWPKFKSRYLSEQRGHYRQSPEDFEGLLERAEDENLVLLCYERFEGQETKCHRMILYDILKKVAEKDRFEVDFIDETPFRR
tara:strand:- start:8077 stop:8487 length:411 start_codon:yes stop_codon:yes gene_type:complete